MKFKIFTFSLLALASCMFAATLTWEASWTGDGAVPFDTVLIGRIQRNDVSPLNGSGLYIGYEGVDGYWLSKPMVFVKKDGETLNPKSYQQAQVQLDDFGEGYYYFMELYAGDLILAYSGLSGYEDVRWAISGISNYGTDFGALRAWEVTSFQTAVIPEPSSGLLFLIGGALVGLRRKRRAA